MINNSTKDQGQGQGQKHVLTSGKAHFVIPSTSRKFNFMCALSMNFRGIKLTLRVNLFHVSLTNRHHPLN